MKPIGTVLPRLTLSWDKEVTDGCEVKPGIFPKGRGLIVGFEGFKPLPIIKETPYAKIVVIGSPIYEESIDPLKVAHIWAEDEDAANHIAKKLNGVFLLIKLDKIARKLTLINDRFNGIPLYWANLKNNFFASFLYSDLFTLLKQHAGFKIQSEVMFEFLWLQKVQYEKTYDNFSKFLLPASILEISADQTKRTAYWQPDFNKNTLASDKDLGEAFIFHLQRAAKRLTSDPDNKRYGLFLSGGHDSRVALAGFSKPPACYSLAFHDNYEIQCARSVAKATHAAHQFIALPEDLYSTFYTHMATLASGIYSAENAQFISAASTVSSELDVVFNGHGFDYLFQGSYMPAYTIKWFGRPTFFRKMRPLDDIVSTYIHHLSFRLADINLLDFVKPAEKKKMFDSLYAATAQVADEGKKIGNTPYDIWEFFTVHALGRHYSRPNLDSMMVCAEPRTLCFDNDVFNFYLALPDHLRLNAHCIRYALNHILPALGKIPTSNYGIPAGFSPYSKTAWLAGRKLLRHATGNKKFSPPEAKDRTWPDRNHYLHTHKAYQNVIRNAVMAEELREAMPFFDWGHIQQKANNWIEGKEKGSAKLLNSLASISYLLSQEML